jgi:hypothetical protein
MNEVHPIVNGTVLLPGMTFTARHRITGRFDRYRYRGTVGTSRSTGRLWVNAVDRRGLCRSIPVDSITIVHKTKAVA